MTIALCGIEPTFPELMEYRSTGVVPASVLARAHRTAVKMRRQLAEHCRDHWVPPQFKRKVEAYIERRFRDLKALQCPVCGVPVSKPCKKPAKCSIKMLVEISERFDIALRSLAARSAVSSVSDDLKSLKVSAGKGNGAYTCSLYDLLGAYGRVAKRQTTKTRQTPKRRK